MHDSSRSGWFKSKAMAAMATAAIFTCVSVGYADDFYLASGKVVHGALVSETADKYVLETAVGTLNLKKADVVRVVKEGTSALEVQGDFAKNRGDANLARTNWRQALDDAEPGSEAATRLKAKLQKLDAEVQQASNSETAQLLQQVVTYIDTQRLDAAQAALDKLNARVGAKDALSTRIATLQAQVHYQKGIAARDAVKMELEQQELQQAIAADPSYYPAYIALGNALLNNSATAQRGLELLRDGLRLGGSRISESERYNIEYKLAQRYFDLKDYGRAAAAYAALIPAREKYPAYADALDKAVESYVRMGEENMHSDFRQTVEILNTALRLNPKNEKALFLLGRIYLDMGQVENAVVTLQRLVQMRSDYPGAQQALGRAYFKAHDYDKAIDHFSTELAVNGNNYSVLLDRAEAEINKGDYQAAQTDLNNARAMDSAGWLLYYLQGSLAFHEKNYDAAQQALLQALENNSSAIPVHILMGRVLDAKNQPEGASQWLQQVTTRLQSTPDLAYKYKLYLAEALTELGRIAIKDKSPRQATDYLKSALAQVPDYGPAIEANADALLLLAGENFGAPPPNLYKQAEDLYLQAIKLEPHEPRHYLKLARFYQQYLNDNARARDYFNKYVDEGGRDPQVNIWLADAGGQPRDEITSATLAAQPPAATSFAPAGTQAAGMTQPMPGQMPAMVTTTTTTLTSGPQGMALTTTTQTGMAPPPAQPGNLMPQAIPGAAPAGGFPGAPVGNTAPGVAPGTLPADNRATPALATP